VLVTECWSQLQQPQSTCYLKVNAALVIKGSSLQLFFIPHLLAQPQARI